MAKSAYTIKLDYKNALKQEESLEESARDIEKISKTDLMGCMNRISKEWKGEASDAYRSKGQKSAENLLAIAKNLRKTATTIREIAQRTYDAEMRALALAQKREYDG